MLSYTDSFRRTWWYMPLFTVLGCIVTCLFAWGVKLLDNKEKVYTFSLYYDTVVMAAYYLLPLLIFSTRPSPGTICGAILVVVGLFVVKVCG